MASLHLYYIQLFAPNQLFWAGIIKISYNLTIFVHFPLFFRIFVAKLVITKCLSMNRKYISLIFLIMTCLFISCGDDKKEETSQEDNVIIGRWVVTCVRAYNSQAYTNTLEKTWDFVNYTQTISNITSYNDVSDQETKQYSSFEEMAEDVHLKGLIFEKNGVCKSIVYSEGGWKVYDDSFKFEVDGDIIFRVNGSGKTLFGKLSYNGNIPQLKVTTVLELDGYNVTEERILLKF